MVQSYTHEIQCNFKLQHYPFDTQVCNIAWVLESDWKLDQVNSANILFEFWSLLFLCLPSNFSSKIKPACPSQKVEGECQIWTTLEGGRVHHRPHAFSLARCLNKNSSKCARREKIIWAMSSNDGSNKLSAQSRPICQKNEQVSKQTVGKLAIYHGNLPRVKVMFNLFPTNFVQFQRTWFGRCCHEKALSK